MTDWTATCVICARHGRTTRLEHGHVCARCHTGLTHALDEIIRLAADAAAWITPGAATTATGSPAYGSRPPLRVEALDPENTPVPRYPGDTHPPTLLEILEAAEREIREQRGYAPYGEASAQRTTLGTPTLTGCVRFLIGEIDWITTSTDFGVEDFAAEVRDCVQALRRWDTQAEHQGTMVRCPTLNDDGTDCGYRLHYRDLDEHVTCRRCGATRDAAMLAHIAITAGDGIWLDPEAAATYLGCTEGTLRQWARRGRIKRDHGRYLIRHLDHDRIAASM